jgi:hypothetical protein
MAETMLVTIKEVGDEATGDAIAALDDKPAKPSSA